MLATPVSISKETGKVQYKFKEKFQSVAQLDEVVSLEGKLYPVKALPCGKCIGCRLDYSKEWAIRCYLEMRDHDPEKCYFVTLTYDDQHIPFSEPEVIEHLWRYNDSWASPGGSFFTYSESLPSHQTLFPLHLTKFIKDLRRSQSYHFHNEFRFYACGEYGTKTARPHYHLIIFGLELPPAGAGDWKSVRNGNTVFESKYLEHVWQKGNVIVGRCTFESIGYVARYMLKKRKGEYGEFYKTFNIVPEFVRMSRMPGIGFNYYDEFKDSIYEDDTIYISTEKKGLKVKPPRFYDIRAADEFPALMEEIKDIRSELSYQSMVAKEQSSGLDMADILRNEEIARQFKTKILQKRSATE